MHSGIGKQCEETGALEGGGKASLVFGAHACLAAGFNLCAVREEAAQPRSVLVVDHSRLVYTECADLASRPEVTSASASFTTTLASASFTTTLAPTFTPERALRTARRGPGSDGCGTFSGCRCALNSFGRMFKCLGHYGSPISMFVCHAAIPFWVRHGNVPMFSKGGVVKVQMLIRIVDGSAGW